MFQPPKKLFPSSKTLFHIVEKIYFYKVVLFEWVLHVLQLNYNGFLLIEYPMVMMEYWLGRQCWKNPYLASYICLYDSNVMDSF